MTDATTGEREHEIQLTALNLFTVLSLVFILRFQETAKRKMKRS